MNIKLNMKNLPSYEDFVNEALKNPLDPNQLKMVKAVVKISNRVLKKDLPALAKKLSLDFEKLDAERYFITTKEPQVHISPLGKEYEEITKIISIYAYGPNQIENLRAIWDVRTNDNNLKIDPNLEKFQTTKNEYFKEWNDFGGEIWSSKIFNYNEGTPLPEYVITEDMVKAYERDLKLIMKKLEEILTASDYVSK